MKSRSLHSEKFTIIVRDISSPSIKGSLEKKISRWFPNLSRKDILQRINDLPFSINNLPYKVANKIKDDLMQIGCSVEMKSMAATDIEQDILSGNRDVNLPPVRPTSRLRDFFSSTYLTTFVHPKSHAAESFRTLRTNLQFIRNTRDLKSLLITSSTESEGKSTIATNLAISMAQTDTSVLLIDGDLRQPSLHHAFGYDNKVGLSSYLTKKKELKECIFPTFIKNLSLMFSGPPPPNPAELLALDSMKGVMSVLRESYELVIIDSPPISNVTDPMIMTSIVDGVYLVIFSGKTNKKIAQYAIDVLTGVNASILGIILNNFNFASHYYYQYYYNYYFEDMKKSKRSIFSKEGLGNIFNMHK